MNYYLTKLFVSNFYIKTIPPQTIKEFICGIDVVYSDYNKSKNVVVSLL